MSRFIHFDMATNPTKDDGCSYKSCCHKLFRENCEDKKGFFCTPIELTFPELVGKLDKDQKKLSRDSMPVILVENASAFIPMIRDSTDFMETVLKKVAGKKYTFVGSYTLPFVSKISKYDDSACKYGDNYLSKEYNKEIVKIMRKTRKLKKKNVILHIGIVLNDKSETCEESGGPGHYGVIIKTGDRIHLFDSMQHKGDGYYTLMFQQICNDVFGRKASIGGIFNSVQLTGGFTEDRKQFGTDLEYFRQLQDMDSQNHFCYMWAIWYTQLYVKGGEKLAMDTINDLHRRGIHPTVVIKKYIWSLIISLIPDLLSIFHQLYLYKIGKEISEKNAKLLLKFFIIWFRYVWDNFDTDRFFLASIIECDLSRFEKMSIDDCLEYSIGDVKYVLDNFCELEVRGEESSSDSDYVEESSSDSNDYTEEI